MRSIWHGLGRLRRIALVMAGALAASLLGGNHTFASGGVQQGIDVSPYQGTINWSAVAGSGVAFTYIKAWEGSCCYDDSGFFQTNWNAAVAAGVRPGAYLYFHPADDPNAQATHLIQQLQSVNFHQGDMPPAIDVEVTDGQSPQSVAASLRSLIDDIQAATGQLPAIYTAPSWWDGNVQSSDFTADPLWVANWCGSCPQPSLPANDWGGHGFAAWQYADNLTVPGISGVVDGDRGSPGPPIYSGGTLNRPIQLVAAGVAGNPQAVSTGPGASAVFWRGSDDRLNALFDTNGSISHLWNAALPANMASDPTAVALPNGGVDVFWQTTGGALWMAGSAGGYQPQDLGVAGVTSAPEATTGAGGIVGLAWRGSDGSVWTMQISATARTQPQSVGPSAPAGAAYPVYLTTAALAVFWRGTDQNLWWDLEANGVWQGAQNLGDGPLASDPRPISPTPGVIDVFWLGTDTRVYQASDAGVWGAPLAISGAGVTQQPDALATGSGAVSVYLREQSGDLGIASFDPTTGWYGPALLGDGPLASIPTGSVASGDGSVDVYWSGTSGSLWQAAVW